jgi:hypothetical protein
VFRVFFKAACYGSTDSDEHVFHFLKAGKHGWWSEPSIANLGVGLVSVRGTVRVGLLSHFACSATDLFRIVSFKRAILL